MKPLLDQTLVMQRSPRSGWDIRPAFIASNSPVFQRRTSTPERFVPFIQAIGMADAQVRELMFIHLAQQTPGSSALKAASERRQQSFQSAQSQFGLKGRGTNILKVIHDAVLYR
jgi:hypothetical protein